MALGEVELDDGRTVVGFLCEPIALAGARDITATGGWRAYLATQRLRPTAPGTRRAYVAVEA